MLSLAVPSLIKRHPLGGKVVFSYGMTKCGSTLAFELARTALERSGFPQPVLPDAAIGLARRINFAGHLDRENIAHLTDAVRDIGHPVVVKTHSRPDPGVIDLLENGAAIAQACYRDPREMALSMIDHGRKSRAEGRPAFADIETLDDAMRDITSQIDSLTQWLYRPNCLPLYYEDVAFRTMSQMRRILAQLKLDVPPGPIVRFVLRRRFTQLNLGIKKRYLTQMSEPDRNRFQEMYRPFLHRMIRDRDGLPADGRPILAQSIVLVPTLG